MRRTLIGGAIACAALGAGLLGAAGMTEAEAQTTTRNPLNKPDSAHNILLRCAFSHRNTDDAILYPGQPGRAHDHTYLGNRVSNAFSTPESLLASRAGNTCGEAGDGASYWVPTLNYAGVPQRPVLSRVYYRAVTEPRNIRVPPFGLRIIAGNAHATAPQDQYVVDWGCTAAPESTGLRNAYTGRTMPVSCGPYGGDTFYHVYFPDCWNGKDLWLPGSAHMAYSVPSGRTYWRCPATHPVPLPNVEFKMIYRNVPDGSKIGFSSGPAYTAHGDVVMAWDQARLTELVQGCVNTRTRTDCRRG